jgi:stage V sporulation protein S
MDTAQATNLTVTRDGRERGEGEMSDMVDVNPTPNYNSDGTEVLKVSAHSRPSAVAGAIAAVIRNHGRADVQAIGAGATNQAIKAIAIARDYLQPNNIDIVVIPAFIDVVIADEERTAIRLVVETR